MKWSLLLVSTLVGAVHVQGDTTTSVKVSENDNTTPETTKSAVICRDKEKVCDFLEVSIKELKQFVKNLNQYINDITPQLPKGRDNPVIIEMLQLVEALENITQDVEEKKSDIVQGNLDVNGRRFEICLKKWYEQLGGILKKLIQLKRIVEYILSLEEVKNDEQLKVLNTEPVETSQNQLSELLACFESIEVTATTAGT